MKMFLQGYSAAALYLVLFASGAVLGVDEIKAVGDEVSFSAASAIPTGASIIWKHRGNSGVVIKAIEYDVEDGVNIYNQNFKDITTLDEKTGKITIKNLKLVHSGVYTIDINSKEQTQRFTLIVKERVLKPTITIEKSADSKAAYLTCKYDDIVTMELSIIWKNSTGETVKILTSNERSQSITVHSTGDPENYYTCTLDNIASAATSDPVTEEKLFKEESSSGPGLIIFIVLLVIFGLISAILAALYKWNTTVHDAVVAALPCLKGGQQNANAPNSNGQDETRTESHPLTAGEKAVGQDGTRTEINPLNPENKAEDNNSKMTTEAIP